MSDMPMSPPPMQTQRLVDAVRGVLPDPGASSGLKMAQVVSVDSVGRTCMVHFGDASDVSGPFVYMTHVVVAVGGNVWLAPLGDNVWIVIGSSSSDSGWTNDSARNPIVKTGSNESRGNATVLARYRVSDGWCEWQGHYQIGSTTVWAAGSLLLILPMNPESTFWSSSFASMPGGSVRVYDFSSGGFLFGQVEYGSGANLGTTFTFTANGTGTPASQWTVPTSPLAFATSDILSWNLRFPIQ